jgi:hypothetical protein
MFNRSFWKILKGEDDLEKNFDVNIKIENVSKSIEGIIKISPTLMQNMKKPQELIEATDDYYIATDFFSDYKYICFRELMMIDIDVKNYFITEEFVINNFSEYTDYCFSIYKSRNGFHVFCISRGFKHRSKEFIKFMLENLCDYYYCAFSYIRGCSVRLSKKEDEICDKIYSHLGIYGNKKLIDDKLLTLVKKHEDLAS